MASLRSLVISVKPASVSTNVDVNKICKVINQYTCKKRHKKPPNRGRGGRSLEKSLRWETKVDEGKGVLWLGQRLGADSWLVAERSLRDFPSAIRKAFGGVIV